ncbi:MAG: GNAT family N-acetyltransferase [Promethearchaeota archaeon]
MLKNIVNISVYKKVILKDGRVVMLKRMTQDDYTKGSNYEYLYKWLGKVNKYLLYDFNEEDLDWNKQQFLISLNNAENIILGAFYDEKIIAHAKLNINILSPREKHIGQWSIMIHPKFQNNGLGAHILNCIEVIAKKIGLKRLEAEYAEGNIQAEELYLRKLGYNIEGRKEKAFKLSDGNYIDKLVIGKIL